MLVKSSMQRADLGVMISASHNPYADNGIKLFGPDGYKLSDEVEQAIEKLVVENHFKARWPAPINSAAPRRLDDAPGRYIEAAKSTCSKNANARGPGKNAADCANGAAYHIALLDPA